MKPQAPGSAGGAPIQAASTRLGRVRADAIQESPVARLLPLLLVCVLASCGGGGEDDPDEVRQVLRDFVEATNERDGDALCGELLTQEYKEGATGATGERADEACRQQLDVTTGLKLRLIRVGRVEIDGEQATARALIDTDGVEVPRLFRLELEDGKWKLAAGSSG